MAVNIANVVRAQQMKRFAKVPPLDFLRREIAVGDWVIATVNHDMTLCKILKLDRHDAIVQYEFVQVRTNGKPYTMKRKFHDLVRLSPEEVTRYMLVK